MDCREFRNKHVAFVDDLLSAMDMDRMRQHVTECYRCSRQDTSVRRGLLLVRNLRPIEPSADFTLRLNARLALLGPVSRSELAGSRYRVPSASALAALAAGVFAVAYMAIQTTHYFAPSRRAQVPAVAAAMPESAPASVPAPMANAAFVASVSTGIPVWPAVLLVGQAPMRFASTDFHDADFSR
jgi:hypothetical protein